MKVVDIADEIFRELGEPGTLSIPVLTFWIRANVGALNNYIHENYFIDSSLEIVKAEGDSNVEIEEEEKAILKKMYMIYHYDGLVRSTLGAASLDTVVEIQSDDTRVKKINKNEQSKTYVSMRRLENAELKDLISAYKISKSTPSQVSGDDTIPGKYSYSKAQRRGIL